MSKLITQAGKLKKRLTEQAESVTEHFKADLKATQPVVAARDLE